MKEEMDNKYVQNLARLGQGVISKERIGAPQSYMCESLSLT